LKYLITTTPGFALLTSHGRPTSWSRLVSPTGDVGSGVGFSVVVRVAECFGGGGVQRAGVGREW